MTMNEDYDLFFSVCAAVAKRKKIKLQKPEDSPQDGDLFDYANYIAEFNHIRIRQVSLFPQWWKNEAGPLVGFYQNQVCALLPAVDGGYEMVDNSTGACIKITDKNAAELSNTVFYFYPSLPNKLKSLKNFFTWLFIRVKKEMSLLILTDLMLNLSIVLLPIILIFIFKAAIIPHDFSLLWQLLVLLMVNFCVFILFYQTQAMLRLRLRYKLEAISIPSIWDKILRLPLRFFRQRATADTAFQIHAISEVQNNFMHGLLILIVNLMGSVFLFILLFFLISEIARFTFILVIIYSGVTTLIYLRQHVYTGKIYQYFGQYLDFLLEIITAIVKVRVTNSMGRIFHLWLERLRHRSRTELALKHYGLCLEVLNAFMLMGSPLIFLVLLHNQSVQPAFEKIIGFFIGYFLLFVMLANATSALGETLRIFPLWKKSHPLLTSGVEVERGKVVSGMLSGEIELKNIVFRYHPDEAALFKNLSLRIKPGEFIAVVGPSGSGKSTLFRIILGFEEPEAGEICFDDVHSHFLKMSSIRKQIGVVIQNSLLIPGSIYANIASNQPKMTRTAVWEIAEKVGLASFIKNLPMQLDTLISEGAVSLSGGEVQRIILARALAQKPRILILDEATSALDNTTQAVVQNYLRQLNATQIVAAHRLSTIVHADRIIVMDKGNIVQAGRFDELIKQPGLFSQMAKRQLPAQGGYNEML